MKIFSIFLLLFISIILESTLIQLPLVLIFLFILAVIYRSEWVFLVGVMSGLLLDGLIFRPFGASSLFFLIFLFVVFLYEKKFELRTIWFVIFMSFIGSFVYLLIFGHVALIVQTVCSIGISAILFILFSLVNPIPGKDILTTWKK